MTFHPVKPLVPSVNTTPDWFNVVNYGADPTGTNDSTSAIQTALTAALGGVCYFPTGTYLVSSTLNPPSSGTNIQGTRIQGDGWGTIIQANGGSVTPVVALSGTTQTKVDIYDIRFENSGNSEAGTCIDISYFINSVIRNVSIDRGSTNHFNIGISGEQTGTFYNEITDCRISVGGTSAKGISLSNSSNSNMINNCRILMGSDAGASGIYINSHSNTLNHPDVEQGGGAGIFLDASGHATTITNPYLEANNYGIQMVSGVQTPVVLGGTIQLSTTANINDGGSVNPVLLNAWPNSGTTIFSTLPQRIGPEASDQGLLAWAYDPAVATNSSVPTLGQVQLVRVILRTPGQTVTNVILHVGSAGSGLTTGQNFAGLYNSSGTLLSATADQTTPWGSTGLKTMALTSAQTALAAGNYYVGFVTNAATTGAGFARSGGLAGEGNLINAGLAVAASRFATNGAGVTTLANVTMSANSFATVATWAAVS